MMIPMESVLEISRSTMALPNASPFSSEKSTKSFTIKECRVRNAVADKAVIARAEQSCRQNAHQQGAEHLNDADAYDPFGVFDLFMF